MAPRIIVTLSVSGDGMQLQSNAPNAPRDGVLKQDNVPEIFWEDKRTRKGSKVVVEHNCS